MKLATSVSQQTGVVPAESTPLDPNTTLDIYIGPNKTITELADTVDTLDGIRAETVDILNEKDGTHVELITVEEPLDDDPERDAVDNFVTVHGIGPAVAALLIAGGIRSFKQLAQTPVERIRDILATSGSHFRIHEAENWGEHTTGVTPVSDPATDTQLPFGFAQWPNEKIGGEATA